MIGDSFKRAINQLALESDSRIVSIPSHYRLVNHNTGHIVDMRDSSVILIPERELADALGRALDAEIEKDSLNDIRINAESFLKSRDNWVAWDANVVGAWVEINVLDENAKAAFLGMIAIVDNWRDLMWPELKD